jgi:hypothetical protein
MVRDSLLAAILISCGVKTWILKMLYFQTEGCYRAENLQENIYFGGFIADKYKNSGSLKISDFRI